MSLIITLAYNQKPLVDEEPPGSESRSDRYAEWDEPETIDAVASALGRAGRVVRIEANDAFPERLREAHPDIVFNIAEGLNGPNREAHIPAICEYFDIPYTGSDPLALCLGLDKRRAKEVFRARGVRTPEFTVIGDPSIAPPTEHPLPAIVKPIGEGSSMGIAEASFCETRGAVEARARDILEQYGQPALVERFLPGREFTCAILGNGASARALPIVEIAFDALPAGAVPIYGYEAKWVWDTAEEPLEIFDCPADVDEALAREIEAQALGAFHALGCRDWSRVDLRLDEDGAPHVIEINPLPGVLPDPRQNSCYPKAARAAGLSYDDMILAVLDAGLARHGLHR